MSHVEPYYLELGQRVQRARNRSGLTQAELGGITSPIMTRANVANIESGKQRVLAHTLASLAVALHVQVSDLMPRWSAKAVARAPLTTGEKR